MKCSISSIERAIIDKDESGDVVRYYARECKNGKLDSDIGIMHVSGKTVHARAPLSFMSAILKERALTFVSDAKLEQIKHNQTLSLSEEGDRWEGDVLDDKPYGWGVLYDKDNHMVYEGFRIGDSNTLYGRQYYADTPRIEYEGELFKGRRWGRGAHYDRDGGVLYDGEWINDNPIKKTLSIPSGHGKDLIPCLVEELAFRDGFSYKKVPAFDFQWLTVLRKLTMGYGCFRSIGTAEFVGMSHLEELVIGDNCYSGESFGSSGKGSFVLRDCPRLRKLSIGRNSFVSFTKCVIKNLSSLEEIEMGSKDDLWKASCFWEASLELRSGISRSE